MPPAKASKGAVGASRKGASAAGSSGVSSTADFLKTEDVLQAVLLADSFQVLLPLLNIPMLEYSLEFLVSGGVGELFVFCCSHAGALQAYLDSSKWKRRKGLTIRTVVSDACTSFGDAMRYLDTLDVIKNDFVLISGDVISNVKLDAVVKEHKARVAVDKRNMMTLLFKQANQSHRTRPLDDDAVLSIDPSTQQLLQYDNNRSETHVHLEKTLLNDLRQPLTLRSDLMDAHISICTPEVLMLFTDNFDWQTFHGDFLTGVLGSEILGNKLFVHTMRRDEYAARCSDLRTYDAVSKDLMNRWAYPLVPDNNLLGGFGTTFKYHRGNVYREEGVLVSREAKIGSDTMLGAGSSVGARSTIDKSVLGRDCVIGQNVRITGSYLWNNVTIEDGCVIDRAILADGCTVRAGARVERGVILSYNVVIGPKFTVQPYTKITTAMGDDDEEADDEERSDAEDDAAAKRKQPASATASPPVSSPDSVGSPSEWDEQEVGMGGVGRVYTGVDGEDDGSDDDDDDDEATRAVASPAGSPSSARAARIPYKQSEINSIAPNPQAVAAWLSHFRPDVESEDEWDEAEAEAADEAEAAAAAASSDPAFANQLGGASGNLHFHKFASEVLETLKRGHDEKLPLDDISLEMSGLKFSHNTNVEEFAHATFLALFALLYEQFHAGKGAPAVVLDPTTNKAVMQALGQLLKAWHSILAKFANKLPDQVYMLAGLEQACLASGFVSDAGTPMAQQQAQAGPDAVSSVYTPLFTPVLQLMYNNFGVFSEEAVLQWAQQAREAEGDDYVLLKQAAKFLQWLEEADEEDDDEDE